MPLSFGQTSYGTSGSLTELVTDYHSMRTRPEVRQMFSSGTTESGESTMSAPTRDEVKQWLKDMNKLGAAATPEVLSQVAQMAVARDYVRLSFVDFYYKYSPRRTNISSNHPLRYFRGLSSYIFQLPKQTVVNYARSEGVEMVRTRDNDLLGSIFREGFDEDAVLIQSRTSKIPLMFGLPRKVAQLLVEELS